MPIQMTLLNMTGRFRVNSHKNKYNDLLWVNFSNFSICLGIFQDDQFVTEINTRNSITAKFKKGNDTGYNYVTYGCRTW